MPPFFNRVNGHPEIDAQVLGPAESDLDWFQAHPLVCVRLRPAELGEIEAQEAMHVACGGERPTAVQDGVQGGLVGVVAVQRVMAPTAPLAAGAWFTVELPMALSQHPRPEAVAEAVLEMLESYGGATRRLCLEALRRQFPARRRQGRGRGFG